MSSCNQLGALFKKNFILMKRNLCSSICLIVFPIILFICIALIRKALTLEDINVVENEYEFVKKYSAIYPLNNEIDYKKLVTNTTYNGMTVFNPFSVCYLSNRTNYGVVIDSSKDNDNDNDNSNIIKNNVINIINKHSNNLNPIVFNSNEELFDYVRGDEYSLSNSELCFGFDLNSKVIENEYDYSLSYFAMSSRSNSVKGNIPSTSDESLTPFQTVPLEDSFNKYKTSGYFYMMNVINNEIFKNVHNNTNSNNRNSDNMPSISSGVVAMKFPVYSIDQFERILSFIVPFFLVIVYMIPLIVFVFRMVKDKETRVKEGMKIMGMKDSAYFFSYFLQYLIINLVIAILGAIITSSSLKHIQGGIRFLFLFLYGLSVFGIAYMVQAVVDRSTISIILSIMLYYIFYFISPAVVDEEISNSAKMAASLLSPTALQLGVISMAKFETSRMYLTGDKINVKFSNYSVLNMIIMFIIDTFLYILIGFYLENVVPKQYGTRKSFYFIINPSYWFPKFFKNKVSPSNKNLSKFNSKTNIKNINNDIINPNNNINFQNDSDYLNNILDDNDIFKIYNIEKTFSDGKKALKGVSLNLYKGEIFALLGHNGAGKSTLINILSGLYETTKGNVYFQGLNCLNDLDLFRKKIGICPQHDVLFQDLTVFEHLMLFSKFKGVNNTNNIKIEINNLLGELELSDKKDELSQNLSGGQKRKLSIAIALIGGSEVIFLDEPTSGMDITTRRKLWDILKKFTKDRIIILTTHYMEEASVLGKRIGILSGGELKCVGTPLFLIDRFGKNISLNLIKDTIKINNDDLISNNNNNESNTETSIETIDKDIINFINTNYKNFSGGVDLKLIDNKNEVEVLSEEILIRLPKNDFNSKETNLNYELFFKKLDENLNNLKLRGYSASMPTLEDVFLLVSDEIRKGVLDFKQSDKNNIDKHLSNGDNLSDNQSLKIKENFDEYDPSNKMHNNYFSNVFMNLKWCLFKRYYQTIRNYKIFIMELICPILLVIIGLSLSTVEFVNDPESRLFTIDSSYDINQISLVSNYPYYNNKQDTSFKIDNRINSVYKKQTLEFNDDINSDLPNSDISVIDSIVKYNSILLNKYNSTRVDNPQYNSTDIGSRLGNYLLVDYNSNNNNKYEFVTYVDLKSKDSGPIMMQAMYNSIISSVIKKDVKINLTNAPFPLTKSQKSRTQTRNTSNLVFFVGIGLALIPASFITYIIREKNNTKHLQAVSGISYLAYWLANFIVELIKFYITGGLILLIILAFDKYESYLYALYLLYGLPMVVLTYLVSFIFVTESGAQNFIIAVFFIIGALGGSVVFFLRLLEDLKTIAIALGYIFRVVPLFAFCNGYSLLLNEDAVFFADNPDAKRYEPLEILSVNYVGLDLLYLGLTFILYAILLSLTEMFSSKLAINKFKNNHKEDTNLVSDEGVIAEINKANDNARNDKKTSIKVINVEKSYSTGMICCAKKTKAVRNVCFTLEYGDCFALLGVSGAGKTTMFKCLTNEEFPESGDIQINNKSISSNFDNLRSQLGYCPQIDAIFEDLTVKENLVFYASIKGIPSENGLKNNIINTIIEEMSLNEFINKKSGNLSGGNKRKLSVAIAMIGNPPIILLDEPSAGMDPEARRYMWKVIHKITKKRKKSSVILTTHSMEEAETLCQKMGILVNGKFKCFGSASIIKEVYGKVILTYYKTI